MTHVSLKLRILRVLNKAGQSITAGRIHSDINKDFFASVEDCRSQRCELSAVGYVSRESKNKCDHCHATRYVYSITATGKEFLQVQENRIKHGK